MKNKNQIHGDYMAAMKAEHLRKPRAGFLNVLITGDEKPGSIGKAIGERLVSHGHVTSFVGDVRETEDVARECNRNDFSELVLCHGVTHLDWFEDQPINKIVEQVDVNLTGTMRIIQQFVKNSLELPFRKRIVVVGSMAHKAVLNGSAPYCASKAALVALVRCLAWELAPKGFDVFIVNPSNTEGAPMTEDTIQGLMRYRGLNRAEAEAYWGASLPKDKWLQPDDIAALVDFLLVGQSDYLSGAVIDLPGGQR